MTSSIMFLHIPIVTSYRIPVGKIGITIVCFILNMFLKHIFCERNLIFLGKARVDTFIVQSEPSCHAVLVQRVRDPSICELSVLVLSRNRTLNAESKQETFAKIKSLGFETNALYEVSNEVCKDVERLPSGSPKLKRGHAYWTYIH